MSRVYDQWQRGHIAQMKASLNRLRDHGIEPGGFLMSVLKNDLFEAVVRADGISTGLLSEITRMAQPYRHCLDKTDGSHPGGSHPQPKGS